MLDNDREMLGVTLTLYFLPCLVNTVRPDTLREMNGGGEPKSSWQGHIQHAPSISWPDRHMFNGLRTLCAPSPPPTSSYPGGDMSYSPHRRRKVEDDVSQGFCAALQRSPPPVPPALLRRIGGKEVTGVGKDLSSNGSHCKVMSSDQRHPSLQGERRSR
ncbi:negative regulation of motor neuron migration [Homalodisca vitripennis]|nr:negative regulation of motor neuron migration [Homalodisca vitripennis]